MTVVANRKFQVGKQTVIGTAVTPTAQLQGVEPGTTITPSVGYDIVNDLRGSLGPGKDVNILSHGGSAALVMKCTYDHLPYVLDGLFTAATPTGGGPYSYDYSAPSTTAVSPRYQTLVLGDSVGVYNLVGAVVSDFTLAAEQSGYTMCNATWLGHSCEADALASLTEPTTLTYITPGQYAIYIDAWGGTMGATAYTGCKFSYSLNINPNRTAKYCLGSLYPTGYVDAPGFRWTLNVTLELDAATVAIQSAALSTATKKLIRIKADNGGAGAAARTMTIDLRGLFMPATLFTDSNNVTTLDFTVMGIEDTAVADLGENLQITMVTSLATIYS